MKKSVTVMGMMACLVLLAGTSAMAQVGIFQKSTTWDTATITNTPVAGSATLSNGVYTLTGNGSDIWNNGDEGFFVYNELSGSNSIQAKVKWISAKGDSYSGNSWAKVGVMIREKGDLPESKHYWIDFRCGDGNPALGDRTDAQWRETESGSSGNTQIFLPDGVTDVAKQDGLWLRVSRNAVTNVFTSEYSFDGINWVIANTKTLAMQETVSYGLAITSHVESQTYSVTAEASDVYIGAGVFPKTVTWDTTTIANVPLAGSVVENAGVYTLTGNGSDIWNNGDEGFFIYKELTGPNSISAKVKWLEAKGDSYSGNSWGKIGVMIREKGDLPESKHFWMDLRCGDGNPALGDRTDAQWRDTEKGSSGNAQIFLKDGTTDIASAEGVWYKVTRYPDNVFISEYSLDGNAWSFAYTTTIAMADTVAYGLAITSHVESQTYSVKGEASDVKFGAPAGIKSSAENWELFY